jgi:hypothetical protein
MFDFVMKMFQKVTLTPALGMEEIQNNWLSLPTDTFGSIQSRRHSWNTIITNSGAVKSDIINLLLRQTNLFRN